MTVDKVVAYFNLDMVGMGEDLGASGALNFPTIWEVIKRDQDAAVIEHVKPRVGGPAGSDHTAFIKRGIEAMMLMSSGGVGHQDYHQPEDDVEKIEPKMLRLAGQFVLQGMVNLANETKVKLLISRRQDLYRGLRMQVNNYNPSLEKSLWSQVSVEAKSPEALYDEIYKRVRELFKGSSSSGRPPKKSLTRGLANLKAVGDDVRLLALALDFYGVGRVDIEGDDGTWVVEGRLTDAGKQALKTLEENDAALRLVSPGEELINDVLSAASKPFVITGDYHVTDAMVDRLNSRGVMLAVDLDPGNIGDFLTRLESLKKQLGERKNLVAFLTATKGLDEAKQPLYLGLIDRGWAHVEICGSREQRGLLGGRNLNTLRAESEGSR
ncbi:MAG: M28 family metallopeptidase [Planctomycetota bacterium]